MTNQSVNKVRCRRRFWLPGRVRGCFASRQPELSKIGHRIVKTSEITWFRGAYAGSQLEMGGNPFLRRKAVACDAKHKAQDDAPPMPNWAMSCSPAFLPYAKSNSCSLSTL